jgi:hypothetical protein
MATFIKGVDGSGVPGMVPQIIDFEFLSKGLDALQTRYDTKVDQFKSAYSSLLNKRLSSADNVQFRADYMKKADAYLKQVAMVDLTNPANMQQAMSIFDPLVNDKEYNSDLYKTSLQDSQVAKGNSTRNSMDKDVRATWNPVMDEYLSIGQERLSKTKRGDGSIDKAQVHMWAPWEDVYKYAHDLAKDQGLEITKPTSEGMYMVTRTNGRTKENISTFNQWFKNSTGTQFDKQFGIEAVVRADRQVKSMMQADPNLTEQAAISQLSTEMAQSYVKDYNDDMYDLKENIDEVDREVDKLKREYPKGVDATRLEYLNALQERKQNLTSQLDKMKMGKVSDQDLQDNTQKLFAENPGQMYFSSIKNEYAQRFAINWASKEITKVEADQVKLQEDSQRFQMAKMRAEQEFEREMADLKYDRDVELAVKKGEIPDGQISTGNPEDIGKFNLQGYYTQSKANYRDKGLTAFTNLTNLAVAARHATQGDGRVLSEGNGYQLATVSNALNKKANGQPLTDGEGQQLLAYLKKVGPTYFNTVNELKRVSWNTISTHIAQNAKVNAQYYRNMGHKVVESINQSQNNRQAYNDMVAQEQDRLNDFRDDPRYRPYILANPTTGQLFINTQAISRLPKDQGDVIYAQMIPNAPRWQEQLQRKASTIDFRVADDKKKNFDYGIMERVINLAQEAGVAPDGSVGDNKMTTEELAAFRDKMVGGKNYSEVFDPDQMKISLKTVNGQTRIAVRIPINLVKGEGTAKRASEVFGMETSKILSESGKNYMEFYLDRSNAMEIVGPPQSYRNSKGQLVEIKNPLAEKLRDLVGADIYPAARSWVSGVSQNGSASFPKTLYGNLNGGTLNSGADGKLYATFDLRNTGSQTIDITTSTGVSASDLSDQVYGAENDRKVREYIEGLSLQQEMSTTTNGNNKVTNNATAASTGNGNYIPWTDNRLRYWQ